MIVGFLRDLRSISRQSKELGRDFAPGDRFAEMNTKLAALNAAMAPTTFQQQQQPPAAPPPAEG